MRELYVVGGVLRASFFKQLPEWNYYRKALILKVQPDTKSADVVVEYESRADSCPPESPSILFKSSTLVENKLYACTQTEVMVYQLPSFEMLHYISLPCFNDVHHVTPTPQGNLLVADTGLDLVVEISTSGEILREWSAVGEETWKRFSRDVDYRKVLDTKPHKAHPNFVFQLGDEVWVTRFHQRDAISLTEPGRRIEIGVQRPHDGHVVGDWIYFTTVDGHLVLANRETLRVEEIFDLNTIDNAEKRTLGWCRGVAVLETGKVWVGFTRIRSTRFKENLLWAKQGFEAKNKPTHITLYDLATRKSLNEIDLEPYDLAALFSIHALPDASENMATALTASKAVEKTRGRF